MKLELQRYFPAKGRFGERAYGIELLFDYVLIIRW